MSRIATCAAITAVLLAASLAWGCSSKTSDPNAEANKGNIAKSVASVPKVKVKGATPESLQAIALASLRAYKAKDLEKLAELGPPGAKSTLIFLEPRNPNYQKLLGDDTWRMKSLSTWDGLLKHVFVGNQFAQIMYGEDGDQVNVIELWQHEGRWAFHDLRQLDKDAFMAQLTLDKPPGAK